MSFGGVQRGLRHTHYNLRHPGQWVTGALVWLLLIVPFKLIVRLARAAWYRPAAAAVAALGVIVTIKAGPVLGASAVIAVGAAAASWRAVRIGRSWGGSPGVWPTLSALSSAGWRVWVLRRDWPSAADAVKLTVTATGAPCHLGKVTMRSPMRAEAVIRVAGTNAAGWDKLAGEPMTLLARELGLRSVTIEPLRSKPKLGLLTFYWASRLDGTLGIAELPAPQAGWAMFGIGEDDKAVGLRLDVSTLFVGESRSGKSSTAWAMVCSTLEQQALSGGHPVEWWLIDQSQTEFASLVPSVGDRYAKGQNQAIGLLRRLQEECGRRAEWLEQRGKRKWEPGMEGMPRIILIVDEFLMLINKRMNRKAGTQAEGLLTYVLSQAAKYGVVVWAGSQAGQIAVVGQLRELFQQRLCLSSASRAMTDCALGEGANAAGADCHNLVVPRDAGMGWVRHDDRSGYRKFRAVFVTDAHAGQIGRGHLPDDLLRARGKPGRAVAKPGWVYVLWSWQAEDGLRDCLYVGMTSEADPADRWRDHVFGAGRKEWADEVDPECTQTYDCGTKEQAEAEEIRLIHELNPEHNVKRYITVKVQR